MSRRKATATLAGFVILGSAQATEHVVKAMPNYEFSPSIIGIYAGDSIRFENAGGYHNARVVYFNESPVDPQGSFCAPQPDCQPSASDWSTVITFEDPGEYLYWCEVHSGVMRGIVVVLEPTLFRSGFEAS